MSSFNTSSTSAPCNASCAYPSWPSGNSFGSCKTPSAFISNEDLFPDGNTIILIEAPAPPRDERFLQASLAPLLPLHGPNKPKKTSQNTRRAVAQSKPMAPINELSEPTQ